MSIPMQTDKCLILGLGKSASEARGLGRFITLGVNDVARFHHTPNVLVILDKPGRFTEERLQFIHATQAKEAWVCYPLFWNPWLPDVGAIHTLKTMKYGPSGLFYGDQVYHYRTSPFAAMSLAVRMGFQKIGLLGVDLLDDHHMGRLVKDLDKMFNDFANRVMVLNRTRIVNCSPISRLTLQYQDLEEF